jgi:hypothetical protein
MTSFMDTIPKVFKKLSSTYRWWWILFFISAIFAANWFSDYSNLINWKPSHLRLGSSLHHEQRLQSLIITIIIPIMWEKTSPMNFDTKISPDFGHIGKH